jgi:putative glycosyltransferase (TIGR04348 family)
VHRRKIIIVTPALADANNGNWQTARRWRQMLAPAYRVQLAAQWSPDLAPADLLIALHARRSAPSIAAWRAAQPQRPLLLVLTGTDLYRDITTDAAAQQSLALADRLVVLNALGARNLPAPWRAKTQVLLQSCAARQTIDKPQRHLRALMVGHLRAEKDPLTYLRAAQRLAGRPDIRLDHIGHALDADLGAQAAALAAVQPSYRWLGGLAHAATRRRIQQAHVLVHPSRLEGGAHVVIEALRSGTPVLASRIDGNVGLLGDDWPGLFEPGDDAALAALLCRARDDAAMLPALSARAATLAPRFAPAAESATLHTLVADLLATAPSSGEA